MQEEMIKRSLINDLSFHFKKPEEISLIQSQIEKKILEEKSMK